MWSNCYFERLEQVVQYWHKHLKEIRGVTQTSIEEHCRQMDQPVSQCKGPKVEMCLE